MSNRGEAHTCQKKHIYIKQAVVDGLEDIVRWGAKRKQIAEVTGISVCVLYSLMNGMPVAQSTAVKLVHALDGGRNKLTWEDITEVYWE